MPAEIVWLDGFVATTGAVLTVKSAALEVAVLAALVKTARYWLLFCEAVVAGTVSVVLVAPPISNQEPPPVVLTCHWTVGAGVPPAAALKVRSNRRIPFGWWAEW